MDLVFIRVFAIMVVAAKFAVKAGLVALSLMAPVAPSSHGEWAFPETVEIPALNFGYRPPGEFSGGGRPIDAPWVEQSTRGFAIMKYQLSAGQYDACVSARACRPRAVNQSRDSGLPAVMLNFQDARGYAVWLSKRTGAIWRLPSDAEWRVAAGSRAQDDALGATDPSDRWLAKYDAESEAARRELRVRARGSFGLNENGLADVAGNVWEWTTDCFVRYSEGARITENCGVRVVEGEHRAYLTDFVRDARGGGCAAGKPPTYLGVRLVREPGLGLAARMRQLKGNAP